MQYLTKLSTSPIEPVSIADMLLWLKQDTGPDDPLIQSLISTARIWAEGYQRTSLTSEQFQLKLEHFPFLGLARFGLQYDQLAEWDESWQVPGFPGSLLLPQRRRIAITLPRGPLISVDSFTYLDTTGTTQTLVAPADYQLETSDDAEPLIYPADGTFWPPSALDPSAVTIQFTAGFTAANIPANTLTALKIFVTAMYQARDGNIPVPPFVMTLLGLDRQYEF